MCGGPLPRSVKRVLDKPNTACHISIITGWEIVLKPKLGRTVSDFETAIVDMGATLLPIKVQHLNQLSQLPLGDHRDPFDRMLIAQALAEDLTIVTSDSRFAGYKRLHVLWD